MNAAGTAGGVDVSCAAVQGAGLRKVYRSRRGHPRVAVDGVDLCIHRGERVAVLGPNGCGKTTLLKIITGALRADAGECIVLGDPRPNRALSTRARVGVVFQSPGLDPLLTVRENLETHARVCGLSQEAAAVASNEAMEAFGIFDRAADRVSVLSGGLARRVDLARATLPVHPDGPGLLLLDEPTAGLDPTSRAAFRAALDRLAAQWPELAIVMTTHLFEDAAWCARAVLMSDGRIVADGAPEQLTKTLGTVVVRVHGLQGAAEHGVILDRLGALGGVSLWSDAPGGPDHRAESGEMVRVVFPPVAGEPVDIGRISQSVAAWCGDRGVGYSIGAVTLEEVYQARVGHPPKKASVVRTTGAHGVPQ